MRHAKLFVIAASLLAQPARAGELFVGIEDPQAPVRVSDLSGFPNVAYRDLFNFEVAAAAAAPDGTLYLCKGAFQTDLYRVAPGGSPQYLCRIGVDIHGLGYAEGLLYGYSNFAPTKGIYQIDEVTGAAKLVLDVYTNTSFRFFAFDYNPRDGLFYGYTEYGTNGLYSINLASGEMIRLAGSIPASNGQGRGLAVGNNTVYLTATRGDDGIAFYAYDLEQGPGGTWTPFTQAYPNSHSTGGAAFVPDAVTPGDLNCDGAIDAFDIEPFILALLDPIGYQAAWPNCNIDNADINGDGVLDAFDIEPFVTLLVGP
jgi:hypothetical protein